MRRKRFLLAAGGAVTAGCSAHSGLLPLAPQATYARNDAFPARPLPSPRIVGEVRRFDGQRVPLGWMECDGRTLEVSEYPQLFAILGHGDSDTRAKTFQIPTSPAPDARMVIAVTGISPDSPRALAAAFAARQR